MSRPLYMLLYFALLEALPSALVTLALGEQAALALAALALATTDLAVAITAAALAAAALDASWHAYGYASKTAAAAAAAVTCG